MDKNEREQKSKAAYAKLDEAVRELVSLEILDGADGLVTDYCVAVAIQSYDKNGNMLDIVEPLLPDQGRLTPRYRTFGLLKDLMVQLEAIAGHVTVATIHTHMDDEEDD
jgi:hypothetical protein